MRADYRELVSGIRFINYPELVPLDSAKREGTVAITVDPMLQGQLVNSTLPPSAFDESARAKREETPSFAFAFRDQKLNAAIRLMPLPAQVRWHGRHTVKLADQRAAVKFRWDVEPIVGAPTYLDLEFAPGFPAAWKLKHETGTLRVRHWERLPLQEALPQLLRFGVRTPTQAALLDAMLPAGSLWRFHLAEPLRTKASLVIEASPALRPMRPERRAWSIPLMTPVQRAHVDQTIAVETQGEPIDQAHADGPLTIQTSLGKSAPASIHLQAVQTPGSLPNRAPTLMFQTRSSNRAASMLELCDEARCTTDVDGDGRLTHRLQFRLWHWRDRACELRLPAGMQILAVKVQDYWLDRLEMKDEPAGLRVILPFDQSADFVRYTVLARVCQTPTASFAESGQNRDPGRSAGPCRRPTCTMAGVWKKSLMPLDSGSIARVGLPDCIARQTPSMRWLRQWWNWGLMVVFECAGRVGGPIG